MRSNRSTPSSAAQHPAQSCGGPCRARGIPPGQRCGLPAAIRVAGADVKTTQRGGSGKLPVLNMRQRALRVAGALGREHQWRDAAALGTSLEPDARGRHAPGSHANRCSTGGSVRPGNRLRPPAPLVHRQPPAPGRRPVGAHPHRPHPRPGPGPARLPGLLGRPRPPACMAPASA